MGMYYELIFGASLKEDTPKEVIDTLDHMVNDKIDINKEPGFGYIFQMSSYYFGVSHPVNKFWYDEISKQWVISTRSSVKDPDDIEEFLEWIKPYIKYGSGIGEFYAIVTYEQSYPKIYYLGEAG